MMATLTTPAPGTGISPADYQFLRDYLYRESGIVLDGDKHYLIEARLSPIARKQGLPGVGGLCALLRSLQGAPLRQQVVEAMTTNETLFFRELNHYDALRIHVLPKMIQERQATRKLRFWSAAASSGQEAYSLAMMLLELRLGDWNLEILGTDINESILDRARQGKYMQIEVNRGLPVNYLLKYFQRAGLEWQIRDEVRRMVQWQQFDLRNAMRSRGPFDIIFCRNVLIYFDTATKRKILSELQSALDRGGYLLLGGAETTLSLDAGLKRVEIGQAVLYQA